MNSCKKVDEIWNRFSTELLNFIVKRVNSIEEAEDILQDSFVKIYKNIDKLSNYKTFKSWLYLIVRNTIIDYYRKKKNNIETISDEHENIL